MWGLAIVDPPLENAECGRCPRKADIRPLGEPEVTRIRQKATPQSATPKKTEETEKKREIKKGRQRWDGKKRKREKATALQKIQKGSTQRDTVNRKHGKRMAVQEL